MSDHGHSLARAAVQHLCAAVAEYHAALEEREAVQRAGLAIRPDRLDAAGADLKRAVQVELNHPYPPSSGRVAASMAQDAMEASLRKVSPRPDGELAWHRDGLPCWDASTREAECPRDHYYK